MANLRGGGPPATGVRMGLGVSGLSTGTLGRHADDLTSSVSVCRRDRERARSRWRSERSRRWSQRRSLRQWAFQSCA